MWKILLLTIQRSGRINPPSWLAFFSPNDININVDHTEMSGMRLKISFKAQSTIFNLNQMNYSIYEWRFFQLPFIQEVLDLCGFHSQLKIKDANTSKNRIKIFLVALDLPEPFIVSISALKNKRTVRWMALKDGNGKKLNKRN